MRSLKILISSFPHFDQYTSNFTAHFCFKFHDAEPAVSERPFSGLDSALIGKSWFLVFTLKKSMLIDCKWNEIYTFQFSVLVLNFLFECKIIVIGEKIYVDILLFDRWHLSGLSSCQKQLNKLNLKT